MFPLDWKKSWLNKIFCRIDLIYFRIFQQHLRIRNGSLILVLAIKDLFKLQKIGGTSYMQWFFNGPLMHVLIHNWYPIYNNCTILHQLGI